MGSDTVRSERLNSVGLLLKKVYIGTSTTLVSRLDIFVSDSKYDCSTI